MIKIIGFAIIAISSLGLGLHMTTQSKRSIVYIKDVLEFMKHTKERIEFFNSAIDEIIENYPINTEEFGLFINEISSESLIDKSDDYKELQIPKEASDSISEFKNKLGKTNKNDQLNMCSYCIEKLEKAYSQMQKSLPEKNKITIALCIYAGLMIIILFI